MHNNGILHLQKNTMLYSIIFLYHVGVFFLLNVYKLKPFS